MDKKRFFEYFKGLDDKGLIRIIISWISVPLGLFWVSGTIFIISDKKKVRLHSGIAAIIPLIILFTVKDLDSDFFKAMYIISVFSFAAIAPILVPFLIVFTVYKTYSYIKKKKNSKK